MSDHTTLSKADITRLLSNNRERGGIERTLREFVSSNEMYCVVNELPKYSGKTKEQLAAVKNQLTMKAKSLEMTNIRLVKSDDNILIVNTDFLADEE